MSIEQFQRKHAFRVRWEDHGDANASVSLHPRRVSVRNSMSEGSTYIMVESAVPHEGISQSAQLQRIIVERMGVLVIEPLVPHLREPSPHVIRLCVGTGLVNSVTLSRVYDTTDDTIVHESLEFRVCHSSEMWQSPPPNEASAR